MACLAISNKLEIISDRNLIQNMMSLPRKLCADCFRMKCVEGCVCDCHGTQYDLN